MALDRAESKLSFNLSTNGPEGTNFYEINGYKQVTVRYDHGFTLCEELEQMLKERAAIEQSYHDKLVKWAGKWEKVVKGGNEFGTMKEAWLCTLTEGVREGEVHAQRVGQITDITKRISATRTELYPKNFVGTIKAKKEAEENFARIQKDWAHCKKKVESNRVKFRKAADAVRRAEHETEVYEKDGNAKEDQIKKKAAELAKRKEILAAARAKYDDYLRQLNHKNGPFQQDMTREFEKHQAFEMQRTNFFRDMFMNYHEVLDIQDDANYQKAFNQLNDDYNVIDTDKDIRDYSAQKGSDMEPNWPVFIDYEHDPDADAKSGLNGSYNGGSPMESVGSPTGVAVPSSMYYDTNGTANRDVSGDSYEVNPYEQPSTNPLKNDAVPGYMRGSNVSGASALDDDFSNSDSYRASGTGIQVTALYDYEAQNGDELSFKAGEVFTDIGPREEDGWSTGMLNGRQGLFPLNYIQE
eukprot:Clim_evm47s152 gene=Clim_evmTU47s152